MKKQIRLSESDLYNIIKQVLIEQEKGQKEVWITDNKEFKSRLDDVFNGNSEKFAKIHNKHYGKIVVNGNLDLQRTSIESLPDNLKVWGNLNLNNCKNLTSLPDNLHVEGSLFLLFTPITSLPDNFHVGGHLILEGTQITSLPDNLVVKEVIYIRGTPLKNNVELVKKYKAEGYEFNWLT